MKERRDISRRAADRARSLPEGGLAKGRRKFAIFFNGEKRGYSRNEKEGFRGRGNSGVPRVEAYLLLVMTTERLCGEAARPRDVTASSISPLIDHLLYPSEREDSVSGVPLNHLAGKRIISPRDFQNVGGGRKENGERERERERALYRRS